MLGEKSDQLTLEQVQALDDANRSDYLALRRMFESAGWKLFMGWVQMETNQATMRQLAATSWDQFLANKGQAAAYLTTANIEKITEQTYASILERDDELVNELEA